MMNNTVALLVVVIVFMSLVLCQEEEGHTLSRSTSSQSSCDEGSPFNINHYITCNDLSQNTQLFPDYLKCIEGQIYIRRAYWIGVNQKNTSELVMGFCKFCNSFYTNQTGRFIPLQSLGNQCLTSRKGQLCSCCANTTTSTGNTSRTSPAINSRHFECTTCKKGHIIEYFLFNIIGLALLCFFIFIWNFFPASGGLNALIFFGQMSITAIRLDCMGTIPLENAFNDTLINKRVDYALEFMYGIWNLDFTYPAKAFCFTENFHTIEVLTLNYFVASLPLIVVLFMTIQVRYYRRILDCCGRTFGKDCYYYITCSCLRKCLWLTRCVRFDKWQSIKTLIASCVFLSYTKFTMTTIYLLAPMNLINSSGLPKKQVLFYQGNLDYFGDYHKRYGILAIFFLVTFVIGFPMVLLFCRYKPLKSNTLNRYRSCWKETVRYLDEFLDVCILEPFQRDLKWGKNKSKPCVGVKIWRFSFGIHDYRWYAGWYFILRFSFFAANLFSMNFVLQLLLNEILSMLALTVSLVAQPYKKKIHNQIDAFIFILISVINTSIFLQYYLTYTDQKLSQLTFVIQYILVFIPAKMIAVQFLAKVIVNYRHGQKHKIEDDISISSSSSMMPSSHDWLQHSLQWDIMPRNEETSFKIFYHRYLCNCEQRTYEPQVEYNKRGGARREENEGRRVGSGPVGSGPVGSGLVMGETSPLLVTNNIIAIVHVDQ